MVFFDGLSQFQIEREKNNRNSRKPDRKHEEKRRRGALSWRFELEFFPSRLPCGHPYRGVRGWGLGANF